MIPPEYDTVPRAGAIAPREPECPTVGASANGVAPALLEFAEAGQAPAGKTFSREELDNAEEFATNLFGARTTLDELEQNCPGAGNPGFDEWLEQYKSAQLDYQAQVDSILESMGISKEFAEQVVGEVTAQRSELDGFLSTCPPSTSPEFQEWLSEYRERQQDYRYTLADIVEFYQGESTDLIDGKPNSVADIALGAFDGLANGVANAWNFLQGVVMGLIHQ